MATTTTKQRAAAAGAKTPTDHAAKTEALGAEVTVTVHEFELTFNPEDFDDDDVLTGLENGSPADALKIITGDDAKLIEQIRESLRDENGKLKRSKLMEFVGDAMQAAGQGKS